MPMNPPISASALRLNAIVEPKQGCASPSPRPNDDARKEMRVDAEFAKAGPHPVRGEAVIKAGHGADTALFQCSDDAREIVGIDPHVAVGDNDDVVFDALPHVDEIGDFAVQPVHRRVDDEIDPVGPMLRTKPLDDRDCFIVRILHAEDDLNMARIVLSAERSEVFKQAGLCAVQRFEDRYPRHRLAWSGRSLSREAIDEERCTDEVTAADDRSDPRDNR